MRQLETETGAEGGAPVASKGTQLTWRKAFLLLCSIGVFVAFFAFAGGASAMRETAATMPSIVSDQPDYAPGSTVTLTGANWVAGEAIHIFVNDDKGQTWSYGTDVTADASGNFTNRFQLPASIIATYSVAATGAASGTATTSFTDKATTTLALTSSANPSSVGSSVTFAATVTPQTTPPQPTGQVDFLDQTTGTHLCDNVPLSTTSPFTATCSTSVLTAGSHQIRASYRGDSNFNTSNNAITQIVNGDTTPPVVTKTVTGTLGTNGWYTSTVMVAWSVTDPDSAVAIDSGCGTQSFTSDTASVTSGCTAHSAGGSSTDSVALKIDTTPPGIAFTSRTAANANGWNSAEVTVDWSCSDGLSGIVSATDSETVTTEGSNQPATGTCTDNAGNSASNTQTGINIDKTAPTITASATVEGGDAYTSGDWTNKTVTVSFTCNDTLSDFAIGACPTDVVVSSETGPDGQNLSGNGWNNTDVTATFTATDNLSGFAPTGDPTMTGTNGSSGEGADVSVGSPAFTDRAGNTAAAGLAGHSFKIDKTPPTGSASATSDAVAYTAGAWTSHNVVVSYSCSDPAPSGGGAASGIPAQPADSTVSNEDDNLSASATCSDAADNTFLVGFGPIMIDKTAPQAAAHATSGGDPYTAGDWTKDDVVVSYGCSDPDPAGGHASGVPVTPGEDTVSDEGAAGSADGTCTDRAGNGDTATVSPIRIDKAGTTRT